MAEPIFWNEGVRNLLEGALAPGNAPSGDRHFPTAFDATQGRVQELGPNCSPDDRPEIHYLAWLHHFVSTFAAADVGNCAIAPNVAVFAEVRWITESAGDPPVISYADVQAFVSIDSVLEDWLTRETSKLRPDIYGKLFYFRLDFNPENLGALLRDPLPHVHCALKGHPRVPLRSVGGPNVVADFLEMLIRGYRFDEWAGWAEDVWERRLVGHPSKVRCEELVEAFSDNQHSKLRGAEHSWAMKDWKAALEAEKGLMYSLHCPTSMLDVLDY